MADNKCPAILRKVLALTNHFEQSEGKIYSEFLQEADRVANAKESGTLDIKLSSRLTDVGSQSDGINSSLALVFNFYAKLQSPQAQMQKGGLTYDEIKISNETLSFYETLLLLRDFEVLPKLITKEELLFLWKVGNIQNIHLGKDALRMLDFRQFIDMLAKIAIFAYNKPGLRQVVIRLNGEMITPLQQVQALAAYMHLEDHERTRNAVRTIGVETATLLHNRSAGEKNHRTIKFLKADLRGARVADLLSREGRKSAPKKKTDDHEDDFDEHDPMAYKIGTALQRNIYGMDEGSIQSMDFNFGGFGVGGGDVSRVDSIMRSIHESESMYLNSPTGQIHSKHKGEVKHSAGDDDADEHLPIKGLYVPRVHISEGQERALVQYHPSLGKELMKYAVENTYSGLKSAKGSSIPEENTVFEPSGAAFVDVGTIVQGKECSVRVVVINRGSHEANIQISTRGFVADELSVIKMPSAIAPGLRQVVVVKFRPPIDFVGGCFSTISISSVTNPSNMLFQEETTVHCPVYFSVSRGGGGELPESASRCTLRSLPSLLALQGLSSGTKSTDDLTLFSRGTKGNTRRDGVAHINMTKTSASALSASKSSKTRRLSVAHSLR
jgi:hypothetical protein